jgi:hypothetical protein
VGRPNCEAATGLRASNLVEEKKKKKKKKANADDKRLK